MKALILCFATTLLLCSCDPNSDRQVGRARIRSSTTDNGGGTGGSGGGVGSNSTPTDAPIDGGLSILLLAGTAYGVKRARNNKNAAKK